GGILVRSQPVSAELPRLKSFATGYRYVARQYQRYYVNLGGTFEEYLKKFSGNTRANLRKDLKKFAEASGGGPVDVRFYRKPEESAEFLAIGRELSKKTFQERLLDAGLPSDEAATPERM